ncbi:MAG: hypothetical protein FJ006_12755 [Chloroflexi bacterium]|nr:hypothetical protein [Chloroflexota bacterium]
MKSKRVVKAQVEPVVSLSFCVTAIVERKLCGAQIFDTKLQEYNTHEIITVRGKPWKVGDKVDFREIKTG